MSSSVLANIECHEVFGRIDEFPARGGMAITTVGDEMIVLFGGVSRQQEHFEDLLTGSVVDGKLTTNLVESTGDVPNPRSGHSMVSYGPYVFLFGGIDFIEEAVYNDLYILDTRNWVWGYVGESGHEVLGRNSHSMAILEDGGNHILVIFGGASPEHGPLGDTIYAKLPPVEDIDCATFAVHWTLLSNTGDGAVPNAVEMHSTCVFKNRLLISGGRDIDGNILADTWILTVDSIPLQTASTESASLDVSPELSTESQVRLRWAKVDSLQLPKPSCSHTTFLQFIGDEILYHSIGGFSYDGLAGYVHSCTIEVDRVSNDLTCLKKWRTRKLSAKVANRFGHCISPLPRTFIPALVETDTTIVSKVPTSIKNKLRECQSSEEPVENPSRLAIAAVIFGGVDVENDFNDLWIVI